MWITTSTDGINWTPRAQVSEPNEENTNGFPAIAAGYTFPYGDYLGLFVDGAGMNHVIWGEGASYSGPGGVWYTRGF